MPLPLQTDDPVVGDIARPGDGAKPLDNAVPVVEHLRPLHAEAVDLLPKARYLSLQRLQRVALAADGGDLGSCSLPCVI